MTIRHRLPRRRVLELAGVVAVVCFGAGFLLALGQGSGPRPRGEVATAARSDPTRSVSSSTSTTTTTRAPATTSSSAPATTAPPASAPPTTTSATAPPTTGSAPVPTAPAAVSTTVASTAPTSRLEVAYPQDAAGRLALGPGATATVVIRNPTRAPAAFDVRGVGSITVGAGSAASGVVQPGSVWSVPLRAGPDIPGAAGADATVTVSDARGVLVVIPVLIS